MPFFREGTENRAEGIHIGGDYAILTETWCLSLTQQGI